MTKPNVVIALIAAALFAPGAALAQVTIEVERGHDEHVERRVIEERHHAPVVEGHHAPVVEHHAPPVEHHDRIETHRDVVIERRQH